MELCDVDEGYLAWDTDVRHCEPTTEGKVDLCQDLSVRFLQGAWSKELSKALLDKLTHYTEVARANAGREALIRLNPGLLSRSDAVTTTPITPEFILWLDPRYDIEILPNLKMRWQRRSLATPVVSLVKPMGAAEVRKYVFAYAAYLGGRLQQRLEHQMDRKRDETVQLNAGLAHVVSMQLPPLPDMRQCEQQFACLPAALRKTAVSVRAQSRIRQLLPQLDLEDQQAVMNVLKFSDYTLPAAQSVQQTIRLTNGAEQSNPRITNIQYQYRLNCEIDLESFNFSVALQVDEARYQPERFSGMHLEWGNDKVTLSKQGCMQTHVLSKDEAVRVFTKFALTAG
eukprot:COSAG01_NODE_9796_length_2341_cov_3.745317_2_plen_341_part_00